LGRRRRLIDTSSYLSIPKDSIDLDRVEFLFYLLLPLSM
jgi:hypothetical protein